MIFADGPANKLDIQTYINLFLLIYYLFSLYWNQLSVDEKKHYRKVHTTVLQLKKEERTLAKWHLAKKKEIQAKGIEERAQLRKDQYTTNLKLHF